MDLFNLQNNIFNKKNSNEPNDGKIGEILNEVKEKLENDKNVKNGKESDIFVVSDISDNKITIVDPKSGKEKEYLLKIKGLEFKNKENSKNLEVVEMEKSDFLNLNITDNVKISDGKCIVTNEQIKIENENAMEILSDLYMNEKEMEGQEFKICEEKENKLFLTNNDGTGGYFSIYKEAYPDFKVGDVVKRVNKKYIKND